MNAVTDSDAAYVVLARIWDNDDDAIYDKENTMAIFESGQPLHAREVTVLGHSFTIWQQQHPEEIRAVLQDMINQGDIKPIAFPGPNTTTLPENFEFIIKGEVAESGEFFFGVSTIEA